ncbi:MAG: thioredoxin family protein [Lachnospiraceae bacterium]
MAIRVKEEDFAQEVLQSDKVVLVEFYIDSCIPCKRFSPELARLEEAYETKAKVVKVNANFDQALAAQYQVLASPTFVYFKKGEEVARVRGLKEQALVEATLKKTIGLE